MTARLIRWRGDATWRWGVINTTLAGLFIAERARWALWLPVAFGAGIAVYFALPVEPPAGPGEFVCLLGGVIALAGRWRARRSGAGQGLPLRSLR
ncbi:MAG: competence protein ComEC [Alphaproteobacteria bacterium]|jgi:competence protein ComEC